MKQPNQGRTTARSTLQPIHPLQAQTCFRASMSTEPHGTAGEQKKRIDSGNDSKRWGVRVDRALAGPRGRPTQPSPSSEKRTGGHTGEAQGGKWGARDMRRVGGGKGPAAPRRGMWNGSAGHRPTGQTKQTNKSRTNVWVCTTKVTAPPPPRQMLSRLSSRRFRGMRGMAPTAHGGSWIPPPVLPKEAIACPRDAPPLAKP